MTVAFKNFASTTLAGGITALDTSLTLAVTTGANFPSTAGNAWFYLTLVNALENPTAVEIVKVTTRSSDTCSVIVRAQDGTTAQAWPSGTFAQLRLTQGTFADLTVQYANNADNLSNLASAATSRTNLGLGTMATQNATAVAITGGTIAGVTATGGAYNGTLGATTPSTVAATTISATGVITSTLASGTSPFTIASTTVVPNLNVSQLLGATWTAPGAIGSVTPSSGAFTTLSASGAVSGAGFTNYMASPPAIGGSTPAAGYFTTISGTTITGTAIRATTSINYRGGDNASATNSGFGEGALDSNNGGTRNTAVGNDALTANTTGNYNVAVGYYAAKANTTGSSNVAIGDYALSSNTTASNNVAIGLNSMAASTTGFGNVAIGVNSLLANISGQYNSGIGFGALAATGPLVNAGSFVIGLSYTIQFSGTTVFTAVGAADNNIGTIFTATGVGAGTGTASVNASNNTAYGYFAGPAITTASNNTTIGSNAGLATSTGAENTFIGSSAGYQNTTGSNNTSIGCTAGPATAALTNTTSVGDYAQATASNQVTLGNTSVTEYRLPGTTAHVKFAGSYSSGAPVTETAATHSVAVSTSSLICNRAGTITVTLPSAATYSGRELRIKTITANTVVSASSNVVPLIGGAAGTAICAAVAGSWALLHSDGSNWIIMAGA